MASSPTSTSTATASSALDALTTAVARRERRVVVGGVALLAVLSWAWLLRGAGMGGGAMSMAPAGFAALLTMWIVMMTAMMLPSAAPAILPYARVRQQRGTRAVAPAALFLAGYLVAWTWLSMLAAGLQLALTHAGLIDPMTMRANSALLAGTTLVLAGLYQLAPLKNACLTHCRSPGSFFARHWRPGKWGAVRLGVIHGLYCVGCCWLLMALLFVGGVMNFAWIAALVALVAAEKLARRGSLVSRGSGITLIGWGLATIIR